MEGALAKEGGLLQGVELGSVACERPGLSVHNAKTDGGEVLIIQLEETATSEVIDIFKGFIEHADLSGLPIERSDARVAIVRATALGKLSHLPALGWRLSARLQVFVDIAEIVRRFHQSGHVVGALDPDYILLDEKLKPLFFGAGFAPEVGPFASPEANKADARIDERADVYSLGRLLYFVLSGESPPTEMEDPAKLLELVAFPAGLSRIIRKAVRNSANDRYPSVDAFMEDLSRYGRYEEVGLAHEEVEEENFGGLSLRPDRTESEEEQEEEPKEEERPLDPAQLAELIDLKAIKPFKLRGATRAILFFLGALSLVTAVAASFAGDDTQVVRIASMLAAGLTGFALWRPGVEKEQLVRTTTAICLASLVFAINPTRNLADTADLAGLRSSDPDRREQSAKALINRGRIGFEGAKLAGTDLEYFGFDNINLKDASLVNAKLRGAQFIMTNLDGARFTGADIRGAVFEDTWVDKAIGFDEAICDGNTRLPNGWSCVDGNPLQNGKTRAERSTKTRKRKRISRKSGKGAKPGQAPKGAKAEPVAESPEAEPDAKAEPDAERAAEPVEAKPDPKAAKAKADAKAAKAKPSPKDTKAKPAAKAPSMKTKPATR